MNRGFYNAAFRKLVAALSFIILVLIFFPSCTSLAAEADVTNVEVEYKGNSRFTFHVTVSHPDEGWSHYVDRWEIRTPDNRILAARPLRHPHVDEQPFTRFLPNVPVPDTVNKVIIQAHCLKDGYGGSTIEIDLNRDEQNTEK